MNNEKSSTPISDSMNRWMQPRAYSHPMVQPPVHNGGNIPQHNYNAPGTQPVPTLNPITPRMKSKKRIRKNVTVLKENTNETMFVNYTVEEKRVAKTRTPSTVPHTLESQKMPHDYETQQQQIGVPARRASLQQYSDGNDANHDFLQRVITPTTRFHRTDLASSSSVPSSPALATPLTANPYGPNSASGVRFGLSPVASVPGSAATSRPSSAVRPNFPQHASYSGASPYAKRQPPGTPHKKNAVYKRSGASVSTTALSTTLESAELDSLSMSLSVEMPEFTAGTSYLDNGSGSGSGSGSGPDPDPFGAFFGDTPLLGIGVGMELGDSDTTALSLPAELFPGVGDSSTVLDMGALLGLASGDAAAPVHPRSRSPTPSPPLASVKNTGVSPGLARTVTGSTVAVQHADTLPVHFPDMEEMFPLGNNTPTDKLQFDTGEDRGGDNNDDIFNILE